MEKEMNKPKMMVFLIYLFLLLLVLEICFMLKIISISSIIAWKIMPILLLAWLIIFIISFIKNLKMLKILYKENNLVELKRYVKTTKLSLIPFWILNFIISSIIMLGFIMGTRGMGIIFLPIPVFFAYMILLITSCYSIFYINLLNKNIKIKKYFMHIILQLCFVLDIIDILYLIKKYKIEDIEERQNGI
jgi:hypothetical protein